MSVAWVAVYGGGGWSRVCDTPGCRTDSGLNREPPTPETIMRRGWLVGVGGHGDTCPKCLDRGGPLDLAPRVPAPAGEGPVLS